MNENIFRIILPLLMAAFIAHRGYYTRKFAITDRITLTRRRDEFWIRMAGLLGILAFPAILVYTVNPLWMNWSAISLPTWLRWLGVGMAGLGFVLLQWAQNTLGDNWSDTPRMTKGQALVTGGPYRWIRHPIYTAFLLILGTTTFISANWLIGLSWTTMTVLEVLSRIDFEERLMLEYFGDQYRDYMNRTGRLLPRII